MGTAPGARDSYFPLKPIQTISHRVAFAESSSYESKEACDKVRRKENLCEKASPNHE
jgi:hypothetical protein